MKAATGSAQNIHGKVLAGLTRAVAVALKRRDLVLLFLVAVGLRLILFILAVDQIGTDGFFTAIPDSKGYVRMAQGLVGLAEHHEKGFFSFGPGYASFLALSIYLFGFHAVPVILVQIILSGVACLLIYKLGMLLTHSRPISIVAGLLAATSYTSISLSCAILSDSLYFFLFTLGLVLFLKGLRQGQWRFYILSGVLTGIAILTRSAGQFWPVMMIIIAIAVRATGKEDTGAKLPGRVQRRLLKLTSCVGIIVAFMSFWIIRNYVVHDIPTLAFTSAGGPANIAAFTLERVEGKLYREVLREWTARYLAENDKTTLTVEEQFLFYISETRKVLKAHPWQMFRTFAGMAWKHLNDINYLHRSLIPDYDHVMVPLEYKIKEKRLNYLNFFLSMMGLAMLLFSHRFFPFFVLGSVYFYYAAMCAAYPWQGSRYFFQGQVAWAVLIAVVLVFTYRFLRRLVLSVKRTTMRRLYNKKPLR